MSIKNELDVIGQTWIPQNASKVRQAIHDILIKTYDTASENGNANMEVEIARGTHPNLRSRLEEVDNKQKQTASQLALTSTALENGKVDKSGQMQVNWANIAQDARENITGGTTAVVGVDSVGTTNIIDNSVTINKLKDNVSQSLYSWNDLIIEGNNATIKPNSFDYIVFQSKVTGKTCIITATEDYQYTLTNNERLVLKWDSTVNVNADLSVLTTKPATTQLAVDEHVILGFNANHIFSGVSNFEYTIHEQEKIKREKQPENHELFLWRDVSYDGSTNTFDFGDSPVFQNYLNGKFVYFIDDKPLKYQLESDGKLVLVWDGQTTINPADKDIHLKVVPINGTLENNEIPIATRIANLITSPIPVIQQAIYDYEQGQTEIPDAVDPVDTLKVKGSLSELAPVFYDKYLAQTEDVTVVLNGDSISTTNYYTAPRDDAKNRPPLMVEHAYVTYIEEQLRWDGQKYYRYDTGLFTEVATSQSEAEYDTAWDRTQADGEQWRNNRPAWTRILEGTDASVSYTVPDGVERCDFIYRTDHLNADTATVTVSSVGVLEVFDENTDAWVEANGFTYSAKEDGVAQAGNILKSIYQKRLKMRVVGTLNNTTVTITNNGDGRLTYWGIQTGIRPVMFDFILSARGGHNISALENYEEWDTDYYEPDLILWQIPIINENLDVANADFTPRNMSKNTDQYASNILTKANEYLAKDYQPELVSWVLFFGKENYAIDDNNEWVYGIAPDGSKVSVPNYINKTLSVLNTNNVNVVDLFRLYLDYSLKVSDRKGVPLYEAVFWNGKNGDAVALDGAHFNTKGAKVTMDIFDSFFLQ